LTVSAGGEHNRGVGGRERPPSFTVAAPSSQPYIAAEGADMTLKQARKRFPLVPDEILRWAVENINDPQALERGLFRLEQAKRLQLRYAS
jgi:hypothetical protein